MTKFISIIVMNLVTLFVLLVDLDVQQTHLSLLNESSTLAADLGATYSVTIIVVNLVTLLWR